MEQCILRTGKLRLALYQRSFSRSFLPFRSILDSDPKKHPHMNLIFLGGGVPSHSASAQVERDDTLNETVSHLRLFLRGF